MMALGLKPNTQWLSKKRLPCKDGHVADSLSERIVDDWFHDQGVKHERSKPYPEGNCTCDFYLPDYDIWVEYFGLWHEHPQYDKAVLKKYRLAAEHGIKLFGISPSMLYPEIKLDLGTIISR